jgi:hypothetical protein
MEVELSTDETVRALRVQTLLWAAVEMIEDISANLWRQSDEWVSYEMKMEDGRIRVRVMVRAHHRQLKHRMVLNEVVL